MIKSTIIFCACFALIGFPVMAEDTIRLTNGEWAPYLSKKLPFFGAASHIVQEAFSAVGVQTEYGFYPWKRSYKLAKEAVYNGTLVWVYTPERAESFYYTDVVINDPEYLFHLKSKPLPWKKVADLYGLKIGATLHTVYPPLEKAVEEGILRIERAGNYENLYRRLLKRRIDAIPQVSQVGKYYQRKTLSETERSEITHSKTVLQERKYHLILSKKLEINKRYVVLFNKGLSIIRRNGTYSRILKTLEDGGYDSN